MVSDWVFCSYGHIILYRNVGFMIIWCAMIVLFGDGVFYETATKGKVIMDKGQSYVVDFSEYAKKQGYKGNYSFVTIEKYLCLEE
jgi:hypothetical protein